MSSRSACGPRRRRCGAPRCSTPTRRAGGRSRTTRPSSLPQDGDGTSYLVPPEVVRRNGAYGEGAAHLTQTFYVETPQPNVLFAAQGASQVYFPSAGLRVDAAGSIRSPILLDEGMVYSVVSDVPVTSPSLLRALGARARRPDSTSYLQVPDSLPDRVRDSLAADRRGLAHAVRRRDGDPIVAPGEHRVRPRRAARARGRGRRRPLPVRDARRGFCEHIASAMAVCCGRSGCRHGCVTGYGPGERNPLTGYFEVQASDAHAWVEVLYPRIGWVPYDPTFGVPEAAPSVASRFLAGPSDRAIGRFLSRAVPEPVKAAVGAIGSRRAAAGAVACRALAVGARGRGARRCDRLPAPAPPHGDPRRGPPTTAGRAFAELVDALAPAGSSARPRRPRPAELPGRGGRRPRPRRRGRSSHAELVVRTFERARFAARGAKPVGSRCDARARGRGAGPRAGRAAESDRDQRSRSTDARVAAVGVAAMCRSIKRLREGTDEPATDDEIHAAAQQYVRKVSGFREPSAQERRGVRRRRGRGRPASAKLLEAVARPRNDPHRDVPVRSAR